jgi:predicted phage tail protein
VRAVNGNGPSAWSSTAYATTQAAPTAPSAPTGLTATAVSATRVDLRWTDTSSTETGFRLERCSGAKCVNFAVVATLGANVTTYSNTGLSAATSYRYRVQAFNASGFSAYSSIVTVKTLRR